MSNAFQLDGANSGRPTRFAPIWTSYFSTGLYSQRNPLRSGQSRIAEKYYGANLDYFIDGSNVEISNRLTPIRRPGNSQYNSQTFNTVLGFYDFHLFTTTSEQIKVMVDTTTAFYEGTGPSTKTLVYTKSTNAGQTIPLGVGNTLYYGNGIDQGKWVQTLFTRTSSASALPNIGNNVTLSSATTPFLETYVIDSNGNLQQLLATKITNITNVTYVSATNLLTLTVGSTAGMVIGDLQVAWGLATATWLNGCTIQVVTAGGTTVTAHLLNEAHADYASAADTGSLAKAVGGSPVTGGSVPTWNTTVPSSGNGYQGGITVDGTALWLNKGNPLENWGIVGPSTAPSVNVGVSNTSWQANTYYSNDEVIVDSNGGLQHITTAGTSGTTTPTWQAANAGVGTTTNDGTVVWTKIANTSSGTPNLTWQASHTYTAGSYIVGSASGTPCLFKLQPFNAIQFNGAINAYLWHQTAPLYSGGSSGIFRATFPLSTGTADATAAGNSILFNPPQFNGTTDPNVQPIEWATLTQAGNISGYTVPWVNAGEKYYMVVVGQIIVPVAGNYTFTINHDDGMLWGIGGGPGTVTRVSGPNTDPISHTGTAVNNYGVLGANNNSGNFNDSYQVNFSVAGTYTVEIDYAQWVNEQQLVFYANGATPVPTPAQSGTSQPIWPVWTRSFAPAYPTVKESQNQLVWANIGPVSDYAWRAQTKFITSPTIIDPNNNIEAPYEPGSTGTTQPTFQTGINQLTTDNPQLFWINQGPSPAPPAGTLSTFNGGWQYAIALVNTATDTVSNAGPLSPATGNFVGTTGVRIGGGLPTTIDPQADYVAIFRTKDGGATPFLITGTGNSVYTIPLEQYIANGYTDTTPDSDLNILLQAPIGGENTPPSSGATNLAYHLNRIFFSIGNVVYWTSGPDTPIGNGNEGVLGINNATFPSLVKRIVPTGIGALIFTVSDIYLIQGNGTSSSPLFPIPYLPSIGILSYNALSQNGTLLGLFTSDSQFLVLDPSAGTQEIGFPIGDLLTADIDPTSVYVTWHVSGSQDKAWYVADGSTGWYRLNPTAAPESGITWAPFATIVGGVKAIRSTEVSPGVHKLLLGPVTSGLILNRDLSVNTDNGSNYADCFFSIGNIVLAQPGQIAELGFFTTDSIAIGSRPTVAILLDEIDGNFEELTHFEDDPPQLAPSQTTYAQRFYVSAGDVPALCRHMQIKIEWPQENIQNELLSLTLFGGFLQES